MTQSRSDSDAGFATDLQFVLNGQPVVLKDVDPTTLLVDWLRSPEVGLHGTKKACGQGGCGACTVMITELDPQTGQKMFRSINACMRPICTLDGKAVTTIEGTGSTTTSLSPVQYRIAKENGSQCGFCTPGFVMNMHSVLATATSLGKGRPTKLRVEQAFDGNLCRCTGYRPILYGMKHFASDWSDADKQGCLHTDVDPADEVPHCHTVPADFPSSLEAPPRALHYRKGVYDWYRPVTLAQVHEIQQHYDPSSIKLVVGNTSIGVYDKYTEDPHVLVDVSHVPELRRKDVEPAQIVVGSAVCYSDLLDMLDALLAQRGKVEPGTAGEGYEALHTMVQRTAGRIVRNAASLGGNTMMVARHVTEGVPFPSDAFTAYCSLGVKVLVSTGAGAPTEYDILDFAHHYASSPALRATGVLVSYRIPTTPPRVFVRTYKTALRPENAHSIVNAGMLAGFDEQGNVTGARIVFGGVGPLAFHAKRAEGFLEGRPWNAETLAGAIDCVRQDVSEQLTLHHDRMAALPDEGFTDAYKLALAEGYFYQFFVYVAEQVAHHEVSKDARSAGKRRERPESTGKQKYERYKDEYPVNKPYIKLGAFLQATGEARYTHDIPLPARGLEAAVVTSMKALAQISYQIPSGDSLVTATAAELSAYLATRYPGFVDYVTKDDIPPGGSNAQGFGNDLLFADGIVTSYGQCIGLVLAQTAEQAIDIAQEIATRWVRYAPVVDDDRKPVLPTLTIDEARRQGKIYQDSQHYPVHVWKIQRPGTKLDWVAGDDSGSRVVHDDAVLDGVQCKVFHGSERSGAQLHFYMETNACVAIPGERNRIVVHSSTQSPDSVQSGVRSALGLAMNHVGVEIARVGGGYGGKTTRSPYVAGITAVAAWKHRRPVKLAMRRENDSAMIGHRHPLLGEYAVAIATGEGDPDQRGRLMGLKTDFWTDGGSTLDCSFVVMDCLQLRADSAYNIPHYQTSGDVCQTNKASNTAMRSMGSVQALLVQEDAIEQAAHAIGMLPEDVREKNLYQLGGMTPVGQVLDYCYLGHVWERIKQNSKFAERLAAVQKFNAENRWKKRGISMMPVKYGSGYNAPMLEQAGALVEVYAQDGTVLVRQGGVEMGQGLRVKVAQVVAKELNIPMGLIEIGDTDTQVVPNPVGTGASTGSGFNAAAAKKACRDLRDRLQAYCMKKLEENGLAWCQTNHIDFWNHQDGWRKVVQITTNGKTIEKTIWQCVVAIAHNDQFNLSAQARFKQKGGAEIDTGLIFKPNAGSEAVYHFTGFTYSAACTEVEIDVLTGETTVLRADVLYDMGDSLNPAIDIGQVEGAYVQGLGYVLSEDVLFQPDGPDAGALNADNTWRYKVPATTSIPIEFNVDLFPRSTAPEVPESPYDLYSSKEVGEPPLVLAITAFFALKHAILAARQDRGHNEWFQLQAPATVQRVQQACLVTQEDLTL
ncbi:molybdopterin cofactor-binding domain-containing protein [Sorangium atrum]|uniref:Molybdopterin-dependent oxidoreductase n=1 Tax=Sorangium atrum TaxID=2995308 RepID=A0ABT5CEN7_9BACT|nr:molybdopterin cofactor-binding domain-containing protein [Sorangium aterium]MDC0684913.1 molybdopterin-dependent oxidoreductase [Sorangium aterium]